MPYRDLLIGGIMYTCFKYGHISTLSRKQMRNYWKKCTVGQDSSKTCEELSQWSCHTRTTIPHCTLEFDMLSQLGSTF
jgi:hypothetical protein